TQIDALNAVQLVLPVTTSVTVSPPTVAVGQTLMVSGAVTNPGLSGSGDLYIGLIRPDGSILFFLGTGGTTVGSLADLGSFRPYASGVSLAAPFAASAPNFYATSRASGDPRGGFVVFVLAVKSGPLSRGTLPPHRLLRLAPPTSSYPQTDRAVPARGARVPRAAGASGRAGRLRRRRADDRSRHRATPRSRRPPYRGRPARARASGRIGPCAACAGRDRAAAQARRCR